MLASINAFVQVEATDARERVIVFFKMRPEAITPDNTLSNIIVSSMVDSPLSSLYHAVQKVNSHAESFHLPMIIPKKKLKKKSIAEGH